MLSREEMISHNLTEKPIHELSKEEISSRLSAIHQLERTIEERMMNKLTPICDEHNVPLDATHITQRTQLLAKQIATDMNDQYPLLIGLMDGGLPFSSAIRDALITLKFKFQYTTLKTMTYHHTQATKTPMILDMPKISVGERHVIVLDDVDDTGHTYHVVKAFLKAHGARSVQFAVLVDKVQLRKFEQTDPTYACFKIPKDKFIVGAGLDCSGFCRNLSQVMGVDSSTVPTPKEIEQLQNKKTLNAVLQQRNAALYPQQTFFAPSIKVSQTCDRATQTPSPTLSTL